MRSKKEVPGKLQQYLDLMRGRYNAAVRCIQSDRGSEYFSQEGEPLGDRERATSAFTQICKLHHGAHSSCFAATVWVRNPIAPRDPGKVLNLPVYVRSENV